MTAASPALRSAESEKELTLWHTSEQSADKRPGVATMMEAASWPPWAAKLSAQFAITMAAVSCRSGWAESRSAWRRAGRTPGQRTMASLLRWFCMAKCTIAWHATSFNSTTSSPDAYSCSRSCSGCCSRSWASWWSNPSVSRAPSAPNVWSEAPPASQREAPPASQRIGSSNTKNWISAIPSRRI
jgi:hypothetical protein